MRTFLKGRFAFGWPLAGGVPNPTVFGLTLPVFRQSLRVGSGLWGCAGGGGGGEGFRLRVFGFWV